MRETILQNVGLGVEQPNATWGQMNVPERVRVT